MLYFITVGKITVFRHLLIVPKTHVNVAILLEVFISYKFHTWKLVVWSWICLFFYLNWPLRDRRNLQYTRFLSNIMITSFWFHTFLISFISSSISPIVMSSILVADPAQSQQGLAAPTLAPRPRGRSEASALSSRTPLRRRNLKGASGGMGERNIRIYSRTACPCVVCEGAGAWC